MDKENLIKKTKENFRVFLPIVSDDGNIDQDQIQFINTREEELFNEQKEDEEDEEDIQEGFWHKKRYG